MHFYKSLTLEEATKRMKSYCAYQERCHQDVIQKLRELRMIPEAIDLIVSHLIQENFLNEERFSRSFARGKFNIKKWGKIRITNELKKRKISTYNINAALKEIDEADYHKTLKNLALKRMSQIKEKDKFKRRRKLADYLLYRGWESELVYARIKELIG
ncbi:MAG: RecX family transcriptional regulator [Croceitalea sp.]|nr:RecX family transcriptional regulator [Croceitalea sp.]